MDISILHTFCQHIVYALVTRNSLGDAIANVNFFYDDIVHELGEIMQNKGHYAVQGHLRLLTLFSQWDDLSRELRWCPCANHVTGDCSLGKFNLTLGCFCSRPTRMLVDSMQENPDVISPQKCLLMGDLGPISNPRPVATITTGRVRMRLWLLARCDRSWLWWPVLDLQRTLDPSNHGSLGLTKSTSQTASQLVQPFLQCLLSLQKANRQTDWQTMLLHL